MKTLKVKPTKASVERSAERGPDASPLVLLNDQDEAHPEGYVLIEAGGRTHEVGDTPRVRELIDQGVLEIVEERAKAVKEVTAPNA